MLINIDFTGNRLFSREAITTYLKRRKDELKFELAKIDGSTLVSQSLDYWCKYFLESYRIITPSLRISEIQQNDPQEAKETIKFLKLIRKTPIQSSFDSSIQFSFKIPYDGSKTIFYCHPTSFKETEIYAFIGNDSLTIYYLQDKPDFNEIHFGFEKDTKNIERTLSLMEKDITSFNNLLEEEVIAQFEPRFSSLVASHTIAKELRFPLIRKDDVVEEYISPAIRRKILSPTASISFSRLDIEQYEDILSIIHSMVMVMERSPNTFRNMGEEDIRTLFLVLLNSIYEGQATGETFNLKGKTDILIRCNGINIFIAECKFWAGAREFSKAINQLLGYKPWRDTKTALLIFNTNKDFSLVLQQIPEVVASHTNFIREISYESETGFRFILHDSNDKKREFILTVLAFDVPR